MSKHSTIEVLPMFQALTGWEPILLRRESHGLLLELRKHPAGWFMACLSIEWRTDTGEVVNDDAYLAPSRVVKRAGLHVNGEPIAVEKDPDVMSALLLDAAEARRHWPAALAWVRAMALGHWAGTVRRG